MISEATTIEITVMPTTGTFYSHCRAIPGSTRKTKSIIIVIDCSSSMDMRAESKGNEENSVFSLLDLVIQACKAIVSSTSRIISIVKYSGSAKIISDGDDRNTLLNKLDNINADGSTNIWDGIKTAYEVAKKHHDAGIEHSDILLFTDGEVNCGPSDYHVNVENMVKKSSISTSLFTFGFGNHIGRESLVKSAEANNGRFAFISSPDMIGTKFVSFAAGLELCADNISFATTGDCPGYSRGPNGKINIGWLLEGSTREFVICGHPDTSREALSSANYIICDGYASEEDVFATMMRQKFLVAAKKAIAGQSKNSFEFLYALSPAIREKLPNNQAMIALANDIDGEIKLGMDHYSITWGKSYLQTLVFAHGAEFSENFKDSSLQYYGGELFHDLRMKFDDMYINMKFRVPHYKTSTTGKDWKDVSSMITYHGQGIPCYGYGSKILTDKGYLSIQELKKGAQIYDGNHYNTVKCILRTSITSFTKMCKIGDLLITPWHPIYVDGIWMFPCETHPQEYDYYVPYVYSVYAPGAKIAILNGVETATLAHGIENENVISHDFWGTQKCIEVLMQMRGWSDGVITISQGDVEADQKSYTIKQDGVQFR